MRESVARKTAIAEFEASKYAQRGMGSSAEEQEDELAKARVRVSDVEAVNDLRSRVTMLPSARPSDP